jgi:hypothetical protein
MYAMHAQTPNHGDTFIDLVDFKWLMAGVGWWIDLSRLQRDMAYAGECVQLGLSSDSNLVRRRSVELLPLLARSGVHASVAVPCASTSLAM